MKICEVEGVSKVYGIGPAEVRALDAVSLAFAPGEFTVISGPSGSGKTTLLNMIGCLDTPTSGSVLLEGKDVSKLGERALAHVRAQRIGFIFQSFNLVPVLSALENVEAALHLARYGGHRRKAAADMLAAVGLRDQMKRRPTQLSGGQQQRIAVARALVKQPGLVIADEPTANLDSKTGDQILAVMRQMNESLGVTFLFSTHDPRVMEHARRIVSLHDGRIEQDQVMEKPSKAAAGASDNKTADESNL